MSSETERWLGPGEAAAMLGITAKALRVYERQGLVAPHRTEAGWRVYRPAHVTRLHQIIALKGLGLPLKKIKDLIGGDQARLRAVLFIQQEALEDQRRKIDRGIDLLIRARKKLIAGETLTLDDVASLTRETVMQKPPTRLLTDRFDELLKERLSDEDAAAVFEDMRLQVKATGKTPADLASELDLMMTEAHRLMAGGDTRSEAAKAMVRRWQAATLGITPPDPATRDAVKDAFVGALADPELGPASPINIDALNFIREVSRGMKERGEL